ncbi:MAG TPA: hypothetical protein VKQ30_18335 [Ktedonobacterales bacterium]|nr:hypothetical protein [Ktedonobacterales bacterium]
MSTHAQAQLDLLLQFHPSVVADTFTRVLNDPLTTDPQSASALPRRLQVAIPGVLLWWDAPGLALNDDGTITVSVTLAGGIRQAPLPADGGRIATISGTLKAHMKPVIGQFAESPRIALELETIDQRGLRASYAGSDARPLAGIGGAPAEILQSVVRDAVSVLVTQPAIINFLRDLGNRPLTLAPVAFPPQSAPPGGRTSLYWPKGGNLLAVGVGQPQAPADFAKARLGLPARADSNVAMTVSSAAVTAKLRSLLATGLLMRSLRDDAGNVLAEMEDLEGRIGAGELVFAARVARGQLHGTLNAAVTLTADAGTGRFAGEVRRMSLDADTVPASIPDLYNAVAAFNALPSRLARGYWLELVAVLLGASLDQGEIDLTQRYFVPGTQVAVSGRATALELADDALTIYAALPADAIFVPQPPHRQPKVAVVQDPLHIPTQSVPGQLVDATVTAMLAVASYEPYDYAWDAANVQHVAGEHGQNFTVRGVPPSTEAPVEAMTKASVTVIDSFGQTDDASGPVLVRPAQRATPHPHPRKLARVLIPAALIVIVILGVGLALAEKWFPPSSPASVPTLAISPQTDYQQTCTPAVTTLPPIFVTLNNSANAAVSWTASAQGTVPGGTEPWASLNANGASASGTITGKGTTVLNIQPASDLCSAVQTAGTQQRFTVSISYGLAGSGAREWDGAAAANAVAVASQSRQVTLSDTIGISDFSAYVLNADGVPTTMFGQVCDEKLTTTPSEYVVMLDNTRSTNAAQWQLSVPDQVPITGNPIEPWASADTPSGSVDAGQKSRVLVTLASDLCQQLLDTTAPDPLRLVVLANDSNPITLTDIVTPPPHIVNLSVSPLTSTQSCSGGLQPITVTLDNTQSNVPVTWQVSSIDPVTPPGTPTPTSGEMWASVSPSTGTVAAGPGGTATVTITPTSDICNVYLPQGTTNTYNVIVTYGNNQSITVTDTITNPATIF